MLTGEYNILIDYMWLTDILSVILLILPFFLIFYDRKWIFGFYVISIVANLPLIFYMSFKFSYELIIALAIIITVIKDLIINKTIKLFQTKESLQFLLFLFLILFVNIVTSIFNYNQDEFINRLLIYIVNIFIFIIFSYFLINRRRIEFVKNSFIIGAVLLVITMVIEMIYGYRVLKVHSMRPAGLLLDPNVCAFALNLALIISFYKTKKYNFITDVLNISARVLIIFGIFITVSRSAYIATVVILIMFLIYYSKGKDKWISVTTVVIFILMYLLFSNVLTNFINTMYQVIDLKRIFPTKTVMPPGPLPPPTGGVITDPPYDNSRITLIKAASQIFMNNFIFGVGIGNVVNEINMITGMPMNAHNLFLQLVAESGIFMFCVLLIFVYYLIQFIVASHVKIRYFVIAVTVLVLIESLFNHNILNINIIWLVLSIITSIIVIYSKEQKVFIIRKETFIRNKRKKIYHR